MSKMLVMQEGKYAMSPEKITRVEVVRILLLWRLFLVIWNAMITYMIMMRKKGKMIVMLCTTKEPILMQRRYFESYSI